MGAAAAFLSYLESPAFKSRAREYIVRELEKRTGAAVMLKSFDWSPWHQRFRLDGLTLHGLEPAEDAPLAQFKRIDIGLNFRTLLEKKIDLFEMTFTEPQFHLLVSPDGKTNLPAIERSQTNFDFETSIQNFNILGGSALINERQVQIDLSLKHLAAVLDFQGVRQVLRTHLRYDGIFDHPSSTRPIPYTFAGFFDYTRATLIAHSIVLNSGPSEIRLQGKIDHVLSHDISSKLAYNGNVDVPFLNYFFPKETFGGKSDVAGFLEFASGYFSTQGQAAAKVVDFNGWRAMAFNGEYSYRFPDRRLSLEKLKTELAGGSVTGKVSVGNLPGVGPSRVSLDLDYKDVDGAALVRAYPWDPKYRIHSNMTGKLNGWFEGRVEEYQFAGGADLQAYVSAPIPDVTLLPLSGSLDYQFRPGQARVANADLQLYSTKIKAEGLVHPTQTDLTIHMTSSNLKDLAFIYADANGTGSFDGVLTGNIKTPVLDGDFTLQDHTFSQIRVQKAWGAVRLDTGTEDVALRDVHVTQGQSQVLLNGSTALSGGRANLKIDADHVAADDLKPFVNRNFAGTFSGTVHLTEISPAVDLDADLRADGFAVEGYMIGDARGRVRYIEPVLDVSDLTIAQNGAAGKGSFTFNRANENLKFSARVTSIDLQNLYRFGLPDMVKGTIREATVSGDGTLRSPNVSGNGTIQNLSIQDETFPQAQVQLASTGPRIDLRLNAENNVNLTAQIDTAAAGYPFTAEGSFNQYSIERLAKFSQGTISATGKVQLSGLLTDRTRLSGKGTIDMANIRVQDTPLQTTKPFTFDFNADRLMLTGVTLAGQATQLNVAGTVSFSERAPLNLDLSGQVDLALLTPPSGDWTSGGSVNVQVRLTGTPQMPDLRGVAHLSNANFGSPGFFTSLVNVNGDLFFDQNRITLNNIQGHLGAGIVQIQGTAQLENGTLQSMNVRFDAQDVRFRYPEGLRTVVDADLVLRGNWTAPLLEGNVKIQNLAYRSDFENFLAVVTENNLSATPSPVGRLRLALHIEGSRNITIQNQLADVEARIDVDLKGTVSDPSMTGHVEASGGTLVFQGNRYRVTRGNIHFADPVRVDPVVDIEAESQVRDYRVILSVAGHGDKLKLNMRSDPPLPELEIVSLIAGGQSREEIANLRGSSAPTSEQVFQSGAASILSDLLRQRVGNRLGFLGSGHVRIEPFAVGASSNTGTRVTVSEQVTKDLAVTYSQDLSSSRQDIILIEYFVSRNTSIQASRDELGNFGMDVRLRKRLK
jgi:translocation and assembly module TamB